MMYRFLVKIRYRVRQEIRMLVLVAKRPDVIAINGEQVTCDFTSSLKTEVILRQE